MKRIVVLFLLSFNLAMGADPGLDALLNKFDYTASEKKAVIAIFDDAKNKGLDTGELIVLLKEQQLKNASYFETVESLAKKEKEIYEVKKSAFPFLDKQNIRYIANYLVDIYSVRQFHALASLLKEKELQAAAIENVFRFHLSLISYEVPVNDVYTLLYLVIKGGYYGKDDLEQINGIYLKSKDLKLNRKYLTSALIAGLGKGKPVKNLVYEIKKNVK